MDEPVEFVDFLCELGVRALDRMSAAEGTDLGRKGGRILETWGSMSERRRKQFLCELVSVAQKISEEDLQAGRKPRTAKPKKAAPGPS